MITSKQLANYIETLLNQIAIDNNFDIVFNGEDGFYDHDWVKRRFGTRITPFVLTTNLMQKSKSNDNSYEFRNTIVAMPFEKDRELIREIFNILNQELDRYKLGDYNIRFIPNNIAFGADFAEGSGLGFRRFEALFEFEGVSSTNYGLEDITLKFGELDIPINSFKFEHSKTNFINKGLDYLGENNHNLNSNLLVIETILNPENQALTRFLNKGQRVNIEDNVVLKLKDTIILDNKFMFENYTITFDTNRDTVVAFLTFMYSPDRTTIKIANYEIPVLDYALAMSVDSKIISNPNSNTAKSIYLGKARSYAFNIVEDTKYSVILDKLTGELIMEDETRPLYDVTIKIREVEYLKRLLLLDITKESKGTSNSILTLKFIDGSEL